MLGPAPDRFDFGDAFRGSPLAAVVFRAQDPEYPIVAANAAYSKLIGTSDLVGTSMLAIRRPVGAGKLLLQSLETVLASGLAHSFDHGENGSAFSYHHHPLTSESGVIGHIIQYLQKKHPAVAPPLPEQHLVVQQHLLELFQEAATGLVIFDLTGKVVDCNPAFATALGQTREEMRRLDASAIVHPADREQRQQLMWRLFNGELPSFVHESRYTRQDGSEMWACDSVSLLRDREQRPQRIIAISEDISKRKRAEKTIVQTESLVTMGRLSASIAHELNNPLESVTNLLFLISNGNTIEDMQYYSRLAEQELARVTKIATETLRFYRPQSAPGPVDMVDVVESVLALFEGRIRSKSVNVIRNYRPVIHEVQAYNGELRQVFLNLVGNSLDAMTEKGSLRISVRASRDWTGTHRRGVRVTVCDTGSGIPKSMLQKVFEPFVSTKEQTGTGLGLWISRDIVKRHGGVLHVRSAETGPRHGTCMSVFLPAVVEQADANAA